MARMEKRLAPVTLTRIKTPGWYADGGGLYLRVKNSGAKQWIFRFRDGARRHEMGLGSFPGVTLGEAREEAEGYRKERRAGKNPLATRRAEAASTMTFRACGEAYIKAHAPKWRSKKHAWQWGASLEAFVYPYFGDLPVQAIETSHVVKALKAIWLEKPETASRVRGRIQSVIDWAVAGDFRPEGANPARWRGHLENLLPETEEITPIEHHPAMPYAKLPEFMGLLGQKKTIAARALTFTILTAARSGETRLAPWSEFDLDAALWTIPAERMLKGKRIHRVPLVPVAIDIINEMKAISNGGPFVFPGRRPEQPFTDGAMKKVLERTGHEDVTVHGFRSTFRDWVAEETDFPNEVAEMALAHAIPNQVEKSYRRGDLYQKRRDLMAAWADYALSAA